MEFMNRPLLGKKRFGYRRTIPKRLPLIPAFNFATKLSPILNLEFVKRRRAARDLVAQLLAASRQHLLGLLSREREKHHIANSPFFMKRKFARLVPLILINIANQRPAKLKSRRLVQIIVNLTKYKGKCVA